MEAVRSLFSMRGSEWSWRRVTGPDGQYCYNLSRTINGSGLDSAIRDEIQRDFEEGLENQIAWIDADETDRRQLEARYPDLVKLMTGGNIPGEIGILKNHISRSEQAFFAETPTCLPFSQLSQDERAWAQEIWNSTFEGIQVGKPSSSELYIHTFSQNTVAPALIIALDKTGGYGWEPAILSPNAGARESSLCGPLTPQVSRRNSEIWLLREKLTRPPVVGSPQSPSICGLCVHGELTARDRMGDMATGARLNVIREYRISDINVSLPSPFGMKVKDYLAS